MGFKEFPNLKGLKSLSPIITEPLNLHSHLVIQERMGVYGQLENMLHCASSTFISKNLYLGGK